MPTSFALAPTPLMATALVATSIPLAWPLTGSSSIQCAGGAPSPSYPDRRGLHGGSENADWLFGPEMASRNVSRPRYHYPEDWQRQTRCELRAHQGQGGVRPRLGFVTHLGHGERKVALSGDSCVSLRPRVQQLADEGQLAANTYFVTGPRCAPEKEDPAGQICALPDSRHFDRPGTAREGAIGGARCSVGRSRGRHADRTRG